MRTRNLSEILRIALLVSWVVMPIAMPAQATFAVLANFDGNDGANPWAALIQAADGDFYGTTGYGGSSSACGTTGTGQAIGCGTVFKITRDGKLTILHSFDSADGYQPIAPLVQARSGNFYGTTLGGGANGEGTFFRITPAGDLTTIYNFENNVRPSAAGLVQGTDGEFYGTTPNGGAGSACGRGCGTVFKITDRGTLTVLHSFDFTDGASPQAGLVQGTDRNFYGTTVYGGANSGGTVFKITPSGALTVLYSFCSETYCADGYEPNAPLVQARSGKFYGTTLGGGDNHECVLYNGCGTVFEMTPAGKLTTIYSFESAGNSGNVLSYFAVSGLVQGADGNFYGTTYDGGDSSECSTLYPPVNGCGTVFKITERGVLTTLHSFDLTDGALPFDGLVQGTDGSFYGTTWVGGGPDGLCGCGCGSCGTVFRISVGLRGW